MKSKRLLAVFLLALCLCLCACTQSRFPWQNTTTLPPIATNDLTPEIIPLAPTSDQETTQTMNASLYYYHPKTRRLTPQSTKIIISQGQTRLETILRVLFSDPVSSDLTNALPIGTLVRSIDHARDIAVVDLSAQVLDLIEPRDFYTARLAICNTLTELSDVKYVSVLVEGQELGLNDVPLGPMTRSSKDIGTLFDAAWQSVQRIANAEDPLIEKIDAILYFAAPGGDYLLPEVRNGISFTDENYAMALLDELSKGPVSGQGLSSVFPSSLHLVKPPTIQTVEGSRVLSIDFDGNFLPELTTGGFSEKLCYGAIVKTLCGFIPGIESISFSINSAPVTKVDDLIFPDGRMRRKDFELLRGGEVTLYFPNHEGSALLPVKRTLSQRDISRPRALLRELISGPKSGEHPSLRTSFPGSIREEDILGIWVVEDQVLINLSSRFQERCVGLDATSERNLLYAMINTLTQLTGVRRVRFYVEGAQVDTLCGSLSLRGVFLRNPGIIGKQ